MSNIDIVVSGLGWMGSGIGSIESAIGDLLGNAQREILLTAYAIGQADRIFDLLESALARGVRVMMVVNRPAKQHLSVQHRLEYLSNKYAHFHLYPFQPDEKQGDLHAKVLVADRQAALIGSSNLSYSGMVINHELAVLLRGTEASRIAEVIDGLISNIAPF